MWRFIQIPPNEQANSHSGWAADWSEGKLWIAESATTSGVASISSLQWGWRCTAEGCWKIWIGSPTEDATKVPSECSGNAGCHGITPCSQTVPTALNTWELTYQHLLLGNPTRRGQEDNQDHIYSHCFNFNLSAENLDGTQFQATSAVLAESPGLIMLEIGVCPSKQAPYNQNGDSSTKWLPLKRKSYLSRKSNVIFIYCEFCPLTWILSLKKSKF